MVYDHVKASSSAECCELFANFFASVFNHTASSTVEAESASSEVPLDFLSLTTFEVTPAMVIIAA